MAHLPFVLEKGDRNAEGAGDPLEMEEHLERPTAILAEGLCSGLHEFRQIIILKCTSLQI